MNELDIHPVLGSLLFKALDHAFNSIADGEVLIPFLLTETKGFQQIIRFIANAQDCGQDQVNAAKLEVINSKESIDACVIAFDGYLNIENERSDAIFFETSHLENDEGYRFAHRYLSQTKDRSFSKLGNLVFLGKCEKILNYSDAEKIKFSVRSECKIEKFITKIGYPKVEM